MPGVPTHSRVCESLHYRLALRGRLRSPGQRREARPAIAVFNVSARRERADPPRAAHMREAEHMQTIGAGHQHMTAVEMHDAEGLAIESGGRRGIVEQHHIAALRVQRLDLRNVVLLGELFDELLQSRRTLAHPPDGLERYRFRFVLAAKICGQIDPGHRLDMVAYRKRTIMLAPRKRLGFVHFNGLVQLRLPLFVTRQHGRVVGKETQ